MPPRLRSRRPARFSDPARSAYRTRELLRHAARHARQRAVITGPIGRRCLTYQLREAGAERAQRRTPDIHAHLRHRQLTPAQQRLRPLDSSRHQVRVGGLPVRSPELPREVRARHQRRAGECRDRQRPRVLAVHQITGATQMRQVVDLLRRHPASVAAPARNAGYLALQVRSQDDYAAQNEARGGPLSHYESPHR